MVFYPFDLNPSGGTLGGQLGYNFQYGAWVFGLEGDWSWVFSASDRGFDPAGSGRYDDVTLLWTGHARGRIGYLYNQFLIFFFGRRGVCRNGSQALRPCSSMATRSISIHPHPDRRSARRRHRGLPDQQLDRPGRHLHDHFGSERYDWVAGIATFQFGSDARHGADFLHLPPVTYQNSTILPSAAVSHSTSPSRASMSSLICVRITRLAPISGQMLAQDRQRQMRAYLFLVHVAFADEQIGAARGLEQNVGPFGVAGIADDLAFDLDAIGETGPGLVVMAT